MDMQLRLHMTITDCQLRGANVVQSDPSQCVCPSIGETMHKEVVPSTMYMSPLHTISYG